MARRTLSLLGRVVGRLVGRVVGRVGPRVAACLATCLAASGAAGCGDDPAPPAPRRPPTVRYASDGTASASVPLPARPRNLLVVCLDTVRADAFRPWGGAPDLMPRTSAFFETGTCFLQAASTSPWTGPSVASVLTGLLPSNHGAREFREDLRLLDAVPTLAEILGKRGWLTRAYTGGGWVSDANGMLQGFEIARHPFSFGAASDPLLDLQAAIVDRPWFFFLHTFEAHDPYGAPPLAPGRKWPPAAVDVAAVDRETAEKGPRSLVRRFLTEAGAREPLFESPDPAAPAGPTGPAGAAGRDRTAEVQRYFEKGFREDPEGPAFAAEMRAAYEAGLRRLDAALGRYLKEADRRGLLENTVVVVLSDHGEGFGEHGSMHHGRRLYDELVHVPLWIRWPGGPRGVSRASVSLCDVVPTVLDLVGLAAPETSDGRSLAAPGAPAAGRPSLSEERKNAEETGLPLDEELRSVRDARWKFVHARDLATGAVRQERYDLAADPGETRPLDADPPEWSGEFLEAVRRIRLAR